MIHTIPTKSIVNSKSLRPLRLLPWVIKPISSSFYIPFAYPENKCLFLLLSQSFFRFSSSFFFIPTQHIIIHKFKYRLNFVNSVRFPAYILLNNYLLMGKIEKPQFFFFFIIMNLSNPPRITRPVLGTLQSEENRKRCWISCINLKKKVLFLGSKKDIFGRWLLRNLAGLGMRRECRFSQLMFIKPTEKNGKGVKC